MTNMEALREQWMWNGVALRIFLWALLIGGLLTSLVLYPFRGGVAVLLGQLPFLGTGAMIGLIYGIVGKKVRALSRSLSGEPGEQVEALVHVGNIQSPAIAILRSDEIVLVPIVGKRLAVPLRDMQSLREGRSLHGKGFVYKRVFLFQTPDHRRIGFALPPAVANRWRGRLRQAGRRDV